MVQHLVTPSVLFLQWMFDLVNQIHHEIQKHSASHHQIPEAVVATSKVQASFHWLLHRIVQELCERSKLLDYHFEDRKNNKWTQVERLLTRQIFAIEVVPFLSFLKNPCPFR